MTSRNEYEAYLNGIYDVGMTLVNTEHCWAGNDKTLKERAEARKLAEQGLYGTVLRLYDPIAFTVGYNDWRANN